MLSFFLRKTIKKSNDDEIAIDPVQTFHSFQIERSFIFGIKSKNMKITLIMLANKFNMEFPRHNSIANVIARRGTSIHVVVIASRSPCY